MRNLFLNQNVVKPQKSSDKSRKAAIIFARFFVLLICLSMILMVSCNTKPNEEPPVIPPIGDNEGDLPPEEEIGKDPSFATATPAGQSVSALSNGRASVSIPGGSLGYTNNAHNAMYYSNIKLSGQALALARNGHLAMEATASVVNSGAAHAASFIGLYMYGSDTAHGLASSSLSSAVNAYAFSNNELNVASSYKLTDKVDLVGNVRNRFNLSPGQTETLKVPGGTTGVGISPDITINPGGSTFNSSSPYTYASGQDQWYGAATGATARVYLLFSSENVNPTVSNVTVTFKDSYGYTAAKTALQGSGTPTSPYLISNADNLLAMSSLCASDTAYLSKSYKLTANIDMSSKSYITPIGYNSAFTGVFDGNNYVIKGIKQESTATDTFGSFGLFGQNKGTIKNVIISGSVFSYTANTISGKLGSITGENTGIIENCLVLDTVVNGGSGDASIRNVIYGTTNNDNDSNKKIINTFFVSNTATDNTLTNADKTNRGYILKPFENTGGVFYLSTVNHFALLSYMVNYNVSNSEIPANYSYARQGLKFGIKSDIDLTGHSFTSIGTNSNPFNSQFDFGNKTVTSHILAGQSDYVGGLFGVVSGTVSNLNIKGSINITNSIAVSGGAVGKLNNGGVLQNINSTVTIVTGGSYVGGVVGENNGNVSNAIFTSIINESGAISNSKLGGIAGINNGQISGSSSNAEIREGANNTIGGIVGQNVGGLTNVYVSNLRSSLNSTKVGYLVGENSGAITHSYAIVTSLQNNLSDRTNWNTVGSKIILESIDYTKISFGFKNSQFYLSVNDISDGNYVKWIKNGVIIATDKEWNFNTQEGTTASESTSVSYESIVKDDLILKDTVYGASSTTVTLRDGSEDIFNYSKKTTYEFNNLSKLSATTHSVTVTFKPEGYNAFTKVLSLKINKADFTFNIGKDGNSEIVVNYGLGSFNLSAFVWGCDETVTFPYTLEFARTTSDGRRINNIIGYNTGNYNASNKSYNISILSSTFDLVKSADEKILVTAKVAASDNYNASVATATISINRINQTLSFGDSSGTLNDRTLTYDYLQNKKINLVDTDADNTMTNDFILTFKRNNTVVEILDTISIHNKILAGSGKTRIEASIINSTYISNGSGYENSQIFIETKIEDSQNYLGTEGSVYLDIQRIEQNISFEDIKVTYEQGKIIYLNAETDADTTVIRDFIFSTNNSSVISIVGSSASIINSTADNNLCSVTAALPNSRNYLAASKTVNLTIDKADIKINGSKFIDTERTKIGLRFPYSDKNQPKELTLDFMGISHNGDSTASNDFQFSYFGNDSESNLIFNLYNESGYKLKVIKSSYSLENDKNSNAKFKIYLPASRNYNEAETIFYISVTRQNVYLTVVNGQNKIYDGETAKNILFSANIDAPSNQNKLVGDDNNKPLSEIFTGALGLPGATANSGSYTVSRGTLKAENYDFNEIRGEYTIRRRDISIDANTIATINREYNSSNIITYDLISEAFKNYKFIEASVGSNSGLLEKDKNSLYIEFGAGLLRDKNAEKNKAVNISADGADGVKKLVLSGAMANNYSLKEIPTLRATITQKEITATQILARDKTYDGRTDNIELYQFSGGILQGVMPNDYVMLNTITVNGRTNVGIGSVSASGVGNDIDVNLTSSSISIVGVDSLNYTLKMPSDIKVRIVQNKIEIIDVISENREYDGSKIVKVKGGNLAKGMSNVDIHYSDLSKFSFRFVGEATVDNADASNISKEVYYRVELYDLSSEEIAKNYSVATYGRVSVVIGKKQLTVKNPTFSVREKIYDNTTNFDGIITVGEINEEFAKQEFAEKGYLITAKGLFMQTSVGENLNLTVSYDLDTFSSSNYIAPKNYVENGFTINKRLLKVKENSFVLSKYEKVYDGDNTYDLGTRQNPKDGYELSRASLDNIITIGASPDSVYIFSYTLKFNSKNVSDANELTASFSLAGNHASNYQLNDFVFSENVKITPYSLLVNFGELSTVYNGIKQEVTGSVSPLGNDSVQLSFKYLQNGSEVDPIDRGEYIVVPIINNANYKIDNASNNKIFRITKNIVKGLVFDNIEHMYNKNSPIVAVKGETAALDKVDITYSFFKISGGSEIPVNLSEIINAGTYYSRASFVVKDEENFEAVDDMVITIIVKPKEVTLVYTNIENLVYTVENGMPKEHIVGASINGSDIIAGDSAYLEILGNSNKAVNAGEYTFIGRLLDSVGGQALTNYVLVNNNQKFIVAKAKITDNLLNFENKTVTYDGNNHKILLNEQQGLVNLPSEISVRYLYPNGMSDGIRNAGEYNIVVEFAIANVGTPSNPIYNYESINNKTAKLIINPKEVTIELSYGNLIYTGTKHSVTPIVSGHIGNENINLVRLENADNILNAGEYTIKLQLVGDFRNNYTIKGETDRIIEVQKATWTNIGLDSKEVVYDGKAHSLTLNNALPADGQITARYSTANSYTNVGEYSVTVDFVIKDLGQNGHIIKNYNEIQSSTAMLKITPFIVKNVIYSDYSGLVYDRKSHTIKVEYYNEEGMLVLGGVSFSGNGLSGSVSEIKNAGDYSAIISITKDGVIDNNYDITQLTPITVSIAKATVVASFEDSTIVKTYNGTNQIILLLQHETLNSNSDLVVNYSNNQQKNVGEYDISATITPKAEFAGNYVTITAPTSKLIINKAGIVLNYKGTDGLVYDGSEKTINFDIAGGILFGDRINVELVNNKFIYAGTYKVEANITDSASNYYIENPQINVVVDKRSLTDYKLVDKVVTYDGNPHTLELNKPLPDDNQVKLVILEGAKTDVLSLFGGEYGSYNITAIFTIEPIIIDGKPIYNYYDITATSGLLTIKPREVKVDYYDYSNLKYNGEEQFINASYSDIKGQIINANVSYNNITINAGNYIAYANITDSNYIPTNATSRLSFKIGKKQLEVNINKENSYTYNGQKQRIGVDLIGILSQDAGAYPTIIYGATGDSMLNAGLYDISIGVSNKNYEIVPDKALIKIYMAKVKLIISVEDLVVKYGEEINFYYTYQGFIVGESPDNLVARPKITLATKEPGRYSVTPYGASSVNYDIIYKSGLLTINTNYIEDSVNNEGKLEGSFSPDTVLKIYKTEGSDANMKAPKNYEVSGQYSFELVRNGSIVELPPDETITVRIKLNDKQLSKDEYKVVYTNALGELVYVENARVENGYLVFETDELRTYTLLTATNYTFIFVVVGMVFVLIVGGMMFILFRKKY